MSSAKMRGAIVLAKSLAAFGADGELAHALAQRDNLLINLAQIIRARLAALNHKPIITQRHNLKKIKYVCQSTG